MTNNPMPRDCIVLPAEYYYSEGERISKANNMVFNWKKVIVKGVAHDFEAMMVQTINYLF